MLRLMSRHGSVSASLTPCFRQWKNNLSKQASGKDARPKIEIKTMKMSYKISEHDLKIKIGQMSSWLKGKCEVKVSIAADGSPGSKAQTEEILNAIQSKIPESEAKQVIKKANGIHFMLRLAGKSELQESKDHDKPSAISVDERREKIKEELTKELSGMLDELVDDKYKK